MVSLVITICIVSLSTMSLLSETMSAPPHSHFPRRKLGPLYGSMPVTHDGSSMSEEEEEQRKNIVDSTGDLYASQDKKAITRRMRMMTAGKEDKDDKSRGTRREVWSSNNNPKSDRDYYKYYFTMDYSGVRRQRPIHNKSQPSLASITPP